jgi:hypothetical protein
MLVDSIRFVQYIKVFREEEDYLGSSPRASWVSDHNKIADLTQYAGHMKSDYEIILDKFR